MKFLKLSIIYSLGRNSVTDLFKGLVELNWIHLKRMDLTEYYLTIPKGHQWIGIAANY